MKYLVIIILSFSLASCSIFQSNRIKLKNLKPPKVPTKEEFDTISIETFQLRRMDTITYKYNNVFYMEKEDSLYKVVAKKELIQPCEKMIIGNFYNLKLGGTYPKMLMQSYLIGGMAMYENESVTIERDSNAKIKWDIYITPYIRGVCYIRD